jgi:hypothetical protein
MKPGNPTTIAEGANSCENRRFWKMRRALAQGSLFEANFFCASRDESFEDHFVKG